MFWQSSMIGYEEIIQAVGRWPIEPTPKATIRQSSRGSTFAALASTVVGAGGYPRFAKNSGGSGSKELGMPSEIPGWSLQILCLNAQYP